MLHNHTEEFYLTNMELANAKHTSMIVLLVSNLIMIFIAICLHRFVIQRNGNVLVIIQRIISCLTSGILLGTLLMLILPNSLNLIAHQSHNYNIGYLLIGLGFFLLCIIKDLINLYESYSLNKQIKIENEQLINSSTISNQDNQTTRLITLIFALGVHYFFSGVLIGGQIDTRTLWILLGAICFHMSLIAFSVTLRFLIDNGNSIRIICAMCIWSIMGPIGVFVSFLISSNSSGLNLANGILQCLSAGTFVYITFIDMIHDDLMKKILYPFLNIILIFIGFLIIVLTSLWHKHPN